MRETISSPRVVINTRPIERAAPLSAALAASNHTVVELPLLTLQPRQASEQDDLLMQRWLRGAYAVTVVVSPTAAAMAIEYWHQAKQKMDLVAETVDVNIAVGPQPSHIIAVGDATAAVLRDHGLTVQQPLIANNEGMLQMPLVSELKASDEVLMWRGLGGRRLLVDTLRQRGINVDSIAWYERIWPQASAPLYQQWLNDYLLARQNLATQSESAHNKSINNKSKPPIVIISSGAAFEYWQHLVATSLDTLSPDTTAENPVNSALQLTDFEYIVLGDRLAAFLHHNQLTYYQVETLDPETLVDAVAKLSLPL